MRSPRPVHRLLTLLAAITVALPLAAGAAQPSAADTQAATAGPPTDYTAVEGLSDAAFDDDELVFEQVRLPMRDGVEIYIEITRPDTEDPVPVILEASPYHGTLAPRIGDRVFPDPTDEDGNQIGLVGYFAPRGYAVAMMGLRGTGRSQGCLDHMGQNDRFDLTETVEWLASRDWSNGKVGMTGHSYPGSTPMIAASTNPEGLATIVPSAGIARAYDHQFQHGVAYAGQYLGLPVAYNVLAIDRHLPPQAPSLFGDTGDNFGNDMQFFGCGLTTTSFQEGHRQVTGEMGPFHAARDHWAGATAWDGPVFLIQGAYDRAVRPPAMGWFNARKNPDDKLWYGQFDHGSGTHLNRRFEQWQYVLHAWFDKHLQGRDVDTGPPVELFVNSERSRSAAISAHEQVFTDDLWPIRSARILALYPDADGMTLADARPASSDSVAGTGSRVAALRENLEFASAPFEQDTLLAGLPVLEVAAAFTQQNVDFIVNVYDENPEDGSRRELSQFAMNPALRDSMENPQPILPGVRYHLRPPGWPMAHVVPEGHRLVLRVTTSDPDKQGLNVEEPRFEVFTGPLGSVLRVPVVDGVLYEDPLAHADD